MKYLLLILLGFNCAFSQTTIEDQLASLEVYLQEQRVHNSGEEIKKDLFDLSIKEQRKLGTHLIKNAMTFEEHMGYWEKTERAVLSEVEFEQLIIGLAAQWQDGHHNVLRKDGGHWSLGLKTAAIQGKLYITGYNPNILPKGSFDNQLSYGDEIIEINGQSVESLKKEFLLYTRMFGGTYESQETTALESMVSRSGRYLRPVKNGETVDLKIKRNGTVFEGTLNWIDVSKMSDEISFYAGMNPTPPKNFVPPAYHYGMSSQKWSQFRLGIASMGYDKGKFNDIGVQINHHIKNELNKIPKDFHSKLTVAPVNRLDAYIVRGVNPLTKKPFDAGVIRIPSYSPRGGYLEVIREFNWIADAIERMNSYGVTFFIIDANANGGGYVDYVANLMRFFAKDGDIKTGSANIKLNRTYLSMLKKASVEGIEAKFLIDYGTEAVSQLGEMTTVEDLVAELNRKGEIIDVDLRDYYGSLESNFADKNQIRSLYKELKKLRDSGEKWSGFRPYLGTHNGISEGKSGRARRSKNPVFESPVVFASDKYSFSGGDYGPYIVRDNGVALVAGETGGGGMQPVYRNIGELPGSELYTRGPYAVSKLPNGQIGENMGAVPHVRREVFYEDLVNGFKNYTSDFLLMGSMLADGKSLEEIRTQIGNNVTYLLTSGSVPKDISTVYKSSVDLAMVALKETPLKSNEKVAKELLKVYQEFNEELALVKEGGFAKYGNIVEIPLPYILLRDDQMLASIYRARSIVDRLELLKNHSRYKRNPNMVKLIEELVKTFTILDNVSSTNTCETIYLSTNTFKTALK